MKCLVLDAMGVIFRAADDVAELLVPFIEEHGAADAATVESAYHEASLGRIDADAFWHRCGVDPALEVDYLERHALLEGVEETLALAAERGIPVWCLSNDIGRWSAWLRTRFDLDTRLAGAVISGDVGLRKPDAKIYQFLINQCNFAADELLFVDDRDKNVAAARAQGIETVHFEPAGGFAQVIAALEAAAG